MGVVVVRICMGRRIGEEVGGGSGVVRNGQLVRLVVRRGLKPVICVGLFGDDLGEIFGEFAMNLHKKRQYVLYESRFYFFNL